MKNDINLLFPKKKNVYLFLGSLCQPPRSAITINKNVVLSNWTLAEVKFMFISLSYTHTRTHTHTHTSSVGGLLYFWHGVVFWVLSEAVQTYKRKWLLNFTNLIPNERICWHGRKMLMMLSQQQQQQQKYTQTGLMLIEMFFPLTLKHRKLIILTIVRLLLVIWYG